jgi:hypothetical protein
MNQITPDAVDHTDDSTLLTLQCLYLCGALMTTRDGMGNDEGPRGLAGAFVINR